MQHAEEKRKRGKQVSKEEATIQNQTTGNNRGFYPTDIICGKCGNKFPFNFEAKQQKRYCPDCHEKPKAKRLTDKICHHCGKRLAYKEYVDMGSLFFCIGGCYRKYLFKEFK